MRVLFFTAAAVAACMANLSQAISLQSNDVEYYDDNALAQSYHLQVKPPVAESFDDRKRRMDQELVVKAVQSMNAVDGTTPVKPAAMLTSGTEERKPVKAGPAPKPTDKMFSAIITEASQIPGALDSLTKKLDDW